MTEKKYELRKGIDLKAEYVVPGDELGSVEYLLIGLETHDPSAIELGRAVRSLLASARKVKA